MPIKPTVAPVEIVTSVLEGYAAKGVFRGFHADGASFRMMWHHDKHFEMLFDVRRKTMTFPRLLPGIPADSPMYREFRAFIASLQSPELLEHRRTDEAKAVLSVNNRAGNVSLSLKVKDNDFEYGARRLIHTVHEIFLCFLADGPYYEYLVEHFGLDPDRY